MEVSKEKTCMCSYMNNENIRAEVHLYIHYTNNTYLYLQEVRSGEREREKERKKERKRERGKSV